MRDVAEKNTVLSGSRKPIHPDLSALSVLPLYRIAQLKSWVQLFNEKGLIFAVRGIIVAGPVPEVRTPNHIYFRGNGHVVSGIMGSRSWYPHPYDIVRDAGIPERQAGNTRLPRPHGWRP